MSELPPNLNYFWASLIIDELSRLGVRCVCLSPGSRCTPLTVAVANHPIMESVVHYDERGAAYFALGYARANGIPAALISTSGTAAANYFPAIVEAAMDNTPLIVLTADRPPELRDCGANQTIDQVKIFGDYVRWYSEIPCPTFEIPPEVILTTIDHAFNCALRSPAGPVHLNCMYREPFLSESIGSLETAAITDSKSYMKAAIEKTFTETAGHPDLTDRDCSLYQSNIVNWLETGRFYTRATRGERILGAVDCSWLKDIISNDLNGLLIVGRLQREQDRDAVRGLAERINWPVFADITSGIRLGYRGDNMVHYHDQLVSSPEFGEAFSPEVVLQIGGHLTSKNLLSYLNNAAPRQLIQIKDHPNRVDPGHKQAWDIECDIALICDQLVTDITEGHKSDDLTRLCELSQRVGTTLDKVINETEVTTEPGVARLISRLIPESHGLFLASSMPIRDMNSYAAPDGKCVPVGSNRGASGIDGTVANACGYARAIDQPVTLVIGDLALLHDLNSLALIREAEVTVNIVVINNDGGGIFSTLPIAGVESVFERFFGTPHGVGFKSAAEMFGLEYKAPGDHECFVKAYVEATRSRHSTIIEVKTDRRESYEFRSRLEA